MDSSPNSNFWNAPLQEIALDGVYYAILPHMGRDWRLGSVNPNWLQELVGEPGFPGKEKLQTLAEKGIWLKPVGTPDSVALMCCGLGSAWPGMGKELAKNFPEAARAIARLADLADWDVYGLLDETDPAILNDIRWQIPYLFLLEYAQWSQLASLGLKPDLICGHSIGELVGLCAAGVYDPVSAWCLFDTRACHMANLEAGTARQSGMLAISANERIVGEILEQYPELKLANANTPGQFITGGPREDLLKARKQLRQQKIPAFMLPMGLAFHNPAMRVLRDLSYRRLKALNIRPPMIPMLSCVTNSLYPTQKDAICQTITNLDENMVNWIGSVKTINEQWNIHKFIELGPQEVLCGLVKENNPDNSCLAAARKGHETEAMRELCARLFASGHLSLDQIRQLKRERAQREEPVLIISEAPKKEQLVELDDDAKKILAALSETVGRKLDAGALSLDLRHDLALRSSSFPLLVQEAENLLRRPVALENLFQISTVGDLVNFLCGRENVRQDEPKTAAAITTPSSPCLARYTFHNDAIKPAKLSPYHTNRILESGDLVILCLFDPPMLEAVCADFVPFGCRLAVPWPLLNRAEELTQGACDILPLNCDLDADKTSLMTAIANLQRENGVANGCLYVPPPACKAGLEDGDRLQHLSAMLAACKEGLTQGGWLCLLQRVEANFETGAWPQKFFSTLDGQANPVIIYAANPRSRHQDFFIFELLHGKESRVIWAEDTGAGGAPICSAPLSGNVLPAFEPVPGNALWQAQFSAFREPELLNHGNSFAPADQDHGHGAWLPVGRIIDCLLTTASLASPWLEPVGLSDILIANLPSMLAGITRECRLAPKNRYWIYQDGMYCRICEISMTCRQLEKNGRHTDLYNTVSSGVCFLSHVIKTPESLWEPVPSESMQPVDPLPFYEAIGFAPYWRFATDVRLNEPDATPWTCDFKLRLPKAVNKYERIGQIVEGILQIALFALGSINQLPANREDFIENLQKWRINGIGFIRFGQDMPEDTLSGRVRLSWLDNRLARFDAQILDNNDLPVLTLNHLEFDGTKKNNEV